MCEFERFDGMGKMGAIKNSCDARPESRALQELKLSEALNQALKCDQTLLKYSSVAPRNWLMTVCKGVPFCNSPV